MREALVSGPTWIDAAARDYGGLYPLAVERHVMEQVGRLMPGVTTVTPHARFYTLHGLVASKAEQEGLPAAETYALARRCEVVLSAVSLAHHSTMPGSPSTHGANAIDPIVARREPVDVDALSQTGGYTKAPSGFWGQYMASEATMGLIDWSSGMCRAGEHLDVDRVTRGLGEILGLASQSQLTHEVLVDVSHLCLCRAGESPDGDAFAERLIPSSPMAGTTDERRQQTIKIVLRLLSLNPGVTEVERQLSEAMLFGEAESADHIITGLDAHDAWTGVILRSLQATAWRDLWQHVCESITGLTPLEDLATTVADVLPPQSLGAYMSDLPDVATTGSFRPLPAEVQVRTRQTADMLFATILLGIRRRPLLPLRVLAYYENNREARERLSPTWTSDQVHRWSDRPVRDFAAHVVQQMVHRAQQIALSKATLNTTTGSLRIPEQVHVRDGYVYRSGVDGGGPVALRWKTLMSVLSGLGLTEYVDGGWVVTARGEAACRIS